MCAIANVSDWKEPAVYSGGERFSSKLSVTIEKRLTLYLLLLLVVIVGIKSFVDVLVQMWM